MTLYLGNVSSVLEYFLMFPLSPARLPCHRPRRFQAEETGWALYCCSTRLIRHSYLCTVQPRGAMEECLSVYLYVCWCVRRDNQCKKGRLPRVICAALVKWTSMMQQPHTHINASTSNLSVSSAEPLWGNGKLLHY